MLIKAKEWLALSERNKLLLLKGASNTKIVTQSSTIQTLLTSEVN